MIAAELKFRSNQRWLRRLAPTTFEHGRSTREIPMTSQNPRMGQQNQNPGQKPGQQQQGGGQKPGQQQQDPNRQGQKPSPGQQDSRE